MLTTILLLLANVRTLSAPAPPTNSLTYILAALLGGSVVTGLVAFLRFRKLGAAEKEDLMSQVAERTIAITEVAMKRLERDLNKAVIDRERATHELNQQIEVRVKLEEEVIRLKERVSELEKRLFDAEKRGAQRADRINELEKVELKKSR